MIIFSFILSLFANHLPVMYVQVPQWADDWAVCAVDIPDAKCHWYVMAPDNTFGEGFSWESAPSFVSIRNPDHTSYQVLLLSS